MPSKSRRSRGLLVTPAIGSAPRWKDGYGASVSPNGTPPRTAYSAVSSASKPAKFGPPQVPFYKIQNCNANEPRDSQSTLGDQILLKTATQKRSKLLELQPATALAFRSDIPARDKIPITHALKGLGWAVETSLAKKTDHSRLAALSGEVEGVVIPRIGISVGETPRRSAVREPGLCGVAPTRPRVSRQEEDATIGYSSHGLISAKGFDESPDMGHQCEGPFRTADTSLVGRGLEEGPSDNFSAGADAAFIEFDSRRADDTSDLVQNSRCRLGMLTEGLWSEITCTDDGWSDTEKKLAPDKCPLSDQWFTQSWDERYVDDYFLGKRRPDLVKTSWSDDPVNDIVSDLLRFLANALPREDPLSDAVS